MLGVLDLVLDLDCTLYGNTLHNTKNIDSCINKNPNSNIRLVVLKGMMNSVLKSELRLHYNHNECQPSI